MSKYLIEDTTLTGIADAIRAKKSTTAPVAVNDFASEISSIEGGGECNHEVYDLSLTTSKTVYLKPQISRPTAEQMAFFVDDKIAHFTEDVEPLEGIVNAQYQMTPISESVTLAMLYMRWERINLEAYYVWAEDVELAKLALGSVGMDATGVTGEGWQLADFDIATVRTLTEDELLNYNLFKFYDYAIPHGDYFGSLFDLYASTNLADVRKPTNIIDVAYDCTLLTQDKVCETDFFLKNQGYRDISDINKDGVGVYPEKHRRDYNNILYVDIDIVGNISDYTRFYICTLAFDYVGNMHELDFGYPYDGNKTLELTLGANFGIAIKYDSAEMAKFQVCTNASVVERSDTEIYISGLRHNTHIVLVEETTT